MCIQIDYTCIACKGTGYLVIRDTPEKAHAERCPVCNGTGNTAPIIPFTFPSVTWTYSNQTPNLTITTPTEEDSYSVY